MRSFGVAFALAALIGAVSLDAAEAMPLGAAKSLPAVAGEEGLKVDAAYVVRRCARVYGRGGVYRGCRARVYRPGYAYGYGYPYYGYGYPYYGPYVGFGYYGGYYGRRYYGGRYYGGRGYYGGHGYYGGRGWYGGRGYGGGGGGGGRVVIRGGGGGRR